jgi:hypothetical protein
MDMNCTKHIRIVSLVVCLLSSTSQAVSPPPDGGYPGGNTAEGHNALLSLTTGGYNTAVGYFSLRSDAAGSFNTALGAGALFANVSENSNTAIGAAALLNSVGTNNTAIGAFALSSDTIGSFNTAIGSGALANDTIGTANIALGVGAGGNVVNADHVICIGTAGGNVPNSCFINQIRDKTTAINDAIPVVIDTAGQLGTVSSSRRFKKEIKPMDNASESIFALKPVTFHYKSDSTNRPEFGLIAEQVVEVNPDLVVCNKEGEIHTVRYDAVNAMLLNEFLKEHRKVADLESRVAKQEAIIAQQQKGIESVIARLKEQDSKIQRVSDEIQLVGPAPQVVASDR